MADMGGWADWVAGSATDPGQLGKRPAGQTTRRLGLWRPDVSGQRRLALPVSGEDGGARGVGDEGGERRGGSGDRQRLKEV